MRTYFTSFSHGYRFRNGTFRDPWPALCGGMSFRALDHYYRGLPIPDMTATPGSESDEPDPEYDALYTRQVDAHAFAIPLLGHRNSRWGHNCIAPSATESAYDALKRVLSSKGPLPLLLGARGNPLSEASHWVVATGYEDDQGGARHHIYLYDCNYPSVESELIFTDTSELSHSRQPASPYGYYAPHVNFQHLDPRRAHTTDAWSLSPGSGIEL